MPRHKTSSSTAVPTINTNAPTTKANSILKKLVKGVEDITLGLYLNMMNRKGIIKDYYIDGNHTRIAGFGGRIKVDGLIFDLYLQLCS